MNYNPYLLSNKTILITGASSGIGRATAIECSKLGADVIITARNEDKLKETYALLGKGNHSYIVADLTSEENIDHLTKEISMIDGCVHCAGFSIISPIQFISTDVLNKTFFINSFAPMILSKHLIKKKKFKRGSSVVFVSSIAGSNNTSHGSSVYGSSKSALNGFMRYAALELADKGIRCNAVYPGRVNTDFIMHENIPDEDRQKDIEFYPLKRYGEPIEIAHAIIYFLSDASSWVTGSSIVIDGGRTLR